MLAMRPPVNQARAGAIQSSKSNSPPRLGCRRARERCIRNGCISGREEERDQHVGSVGSNCQGSDT